jgi:hypothetical protein
LVLSKRYYENFHEKWGRKTKPQSAQRDFLCSPKEYLLLEITGELYPVL